MKISEIMTKEVIAAKEDDLLTDVAEIMTRERIHAVPVVDADRKVLGIVTEGDFFSKQSPAYIYFPTIINFVKSGKLYHFSEEDEIRESVKVSLIGEIMTKDCIVADQDDDIEKFISIVREHGFVSVPVVDADKKLIGIVAVADALKFIKNI